MGIIADCHKFAAISLHGSGIAVQFTSEVMPIRGMVATPNLPFEVTRWWKEQLGNLMCEEIENSELYLVASAPSVNLKVLDGENTLLIDRCRNFFYGLLLVAMISPEVEPQLATGSVEAGEATFRQIGRFELPKAIAGVRLPPITEDAIRRASNLASRLEEIASTGKFGRIIWALNCFMNGLTAGHVYEKQLGFVRAVEAFLLPDQGRTENQFKSRTELFLGPTQHQLVETIYKIRSRIEHLHDPLQSLRGAGEVDKLLHLLPLVATTESIARYCLERFLSSPQLWPHFQSDAAISAFWRFPNPEKQRLWGLPIENSSLIPDFDREVASQTLG